MTGKPNRSVMRRAALADVIQANEIQRSVTARFRRANNRATGITPATPELTAGDWEVIERDLGRAMRYLDGVRKLAAHMRDLG